MKLSILSQYFGAEEVSLPKLAKIGYTRVETSKKESTQVPARQLARIAADCGIEVHSCMGWYDGLGGTDADAKRQAMDGLRQNLDWAAELGAKVEEVFPSWRGPGEERADAWKRCVESLREAGEHAAKVGVVIAIEPVMQYDTRLVRTLAEGVTMAKQVGLDSVKVMGDTHHMHCAERDLPRAVRDAGPWLVNFHFSDNDRLPPGMGQMDLVGIVRALAEVNYEGSLSLSEMAKVPDADTAARVAFHYMTGLIEATELREARIRQTGS
jgi:D-psicose/D-tagatose/L-ribulose 3-epimerase